MKKLFFLIFLISIVGIISFIPGKEVKAWNPHLDISEFNCPDEADEGNTVNVSGACRNPASETYSARDVYLYIGVASPSPAAGEICHKNAAILDPGKTIDCSGSFEMPDADSYVAVICYYDDTGNIQRKVEDGKWVIFTGPCDHDGVKEAGEDCDCGLAGGTCGEQGCDCGGATCVSQGYKGGTLKCKSDCTFNTSGCTGAPPPPSGIGITFQNPLEYETFEDLINAIMDFIFVLAIVALPLVIIVGALQLLTSGGDPKKIESGKKMIFYALIGLTIILLARGIIAMIQQAIGVEIGG